MDPSGNFAAVGNLGGMGISGVLSSMAMVSYQAIVRSIAFAAGKPLVVGSAAVAAAVVALPTELPTARVLPVAYELARSCLKNGALDASCRPRYNIFIVGSLTTPEHHRLVTRAISQGAQFSLTRRFPPHDRQWLRALGCRGSTAANLDCDEYPYASTHQGGQFGLSTFYLLNSTDNRSAGGSLAAFYNRCDIKGNEMVGDQFYVLPIKGLPTTGVCRQ